MTLRIVGVAGSLSPQSKTRRLVESVVHRVSRQTSAAASIIDLVALTPDLLRTYSRSDAPVALEAAFKAVETADLLVVGSPVYKGSYSGLFKYFFDLVDYNALLGRPVALTATGGSDRHALVVEHQFRPLFGFFGAHTLPTGFFVTDRDFADGDIKDPAQRQRLDTLVSEATRALQRDLVAA